MTKYRDIKALNWSLLKTILVSPRFMKYREKNPRKDTAALLRGRAIHCATLEPDRWKTDYLSEPYFGPLNRKGPIAQRAAWAEENASLIERATVLKQEEYELVERCADAIHSHPHARRLLDGGRVEEPIVWEDPETGVLCKARLDFIRPDTTLDLKSTRHGTMREIEADFARLLYHGQAAWYHAGAVTKRLIPRGAGPPHTIIVQTCEPHDVIPGRYSEIDLALGTALTRRLLTRYLECHASGMWPGLAPEVVELDLPRWAEGADEHANDEEW